MPGTAPFSVQYPAPSEGPYANVQAQRLVGGAAGTSVQPIGGGTDIEMMRGIAGMVRSNEAMAQELKETASQIRVLNERTIRMMTTSSSATGGLSVRDLTLAVREGTSQALLGTAAGVLQAMQGMEPGGGGGGVGAVLAQPTPPSAGPAPAPGQPPPPRDSGGRPEGTRQRPYIVDETRGQGYNIGALRQDLATYAARRISESTWAEPGLSQDPETGNVLDQAGNVVTGARAATWLRRNRVLGAAGGAAGTVAEGGSLRGAIGAAMPRAGLVLGRAAGAAGLVFQGASMVAGQREQNAQFQAILGGSNVEGMRERINQRLFGFRQTGGMSGEAAGQLFQGVAETGLRGAERRSALDFGADAYRRFGMSVQESVQLISMAAQNGVQSFGFLTNSLQDVTSAAREAGLNAQVMRQRFVEGLAAATPTAGVQGGAVIASAQTTAAAGFGRRVGGQMTFGGTNDTASLLMQSRAAGMRPNELLAARAEGGRPALAAQDTLMRAAARRLLGANGRRMVDEARAANGGAPLSPQQFRRIALAYMRGPGGAQALILPQQIEMMTGVGGLTPDTAIETLMMAYAGETTEGSTSLAARYDETQARVGGFQVLGGSLEGGQRQHALGQIGMGAADVGAAGAGATPIGQAFNAVGRNLPGTRSNQDEARNAARIYWGEAERTGRAGGVSAALIKNFEGERRFRVQTAHGDRIVTTDDLLRHYRDQADAGTAEIVEGPGAGETIAEHLRVAGDTKLNVTSATNKNIGKHGRSAEDAGGGGGKVEITMTPELRRWFAANPVGGSDPNANRQPPPAQSTPSGLPTDSARG